MKDWQAENRKQTSLEVQAGRRQVWINMANGIIEQMDSELGVTSSLFVDNDDPRKWTVRSKLPNDIVHEENFWDFPSNELKTKIMLLGGRYGNA